MSRQFSIPTMLRMVPNSLLGRFFEKLGHDFEIDWERLGGREIDPVLKRHRRQALDLGRIGDQHVPTVLLEAVVDEQIGRAHV